MEATERRKRLDALAGEPDPARRHLVALSLVSDRLRDDGLEPILVGGAAVEFYTAGGYATKDIDPEDGRWASRLVQLYATELDWGYLESTVASVAQDAAALAELRREATA